MTGLPGFGRTQWRISEAPVGYAEAVAAMEARVAAIAAGEAEDLVWLLEHPSLYTAGTSARPEELIEPSRFPVHRAGRGGRFTYHGPGQRIAYVMRDLRPGGGDVRGHVGHLERWIIMALARFDVRAECRADRIGVWVRRPERGVDVEDKIAAIGVRVRRGVAYHGVALNVEPDLEHFAGIIPCGILGHGVTSLLDLGILVSRPEVDMALQSMFAEAFAGAECGAG